MEDSDLSPRDNHRFTFASIRSDCVQYTPSIQRINICLKGTVVGCIGNRVMEKNIVGIENKPTLRR